VVVSVESAKEDDLVNYLNGHNVPFSRLGEVQRQRIIIDDEDFGELTDWTTRYQNWLAEKMEG